ncbi:beta strand repeat-containing protein, partial [Variovorax sp. CT11-76]
ALGTGAVSIEGDTALSGNAALALGAGGGSIDLGNSTWGFGGAISGNGALSVTGKGGVLNLAVASSYKGGTVVQGAAGVTAGVSGAFGSGPVRQQGSGSRVTLFNAASAGANSYTVGRAGTSDSDNRLVFAQNATAGSADIDVNGSGGQSATANTVQFGDTSSAGTSTIGNLGGAVSFQQSASAGSATISNGANSLVSFADSATAGSSKIANAKGGTVYFAESSTGANATLTNAAGGVVDVSGVTAKTGLSLGALSGAGNVVLGATRLTLGGLNASGTISGIVSDKGSAFAQPGAGTGGAVVKVGTGTLALTGANTYTGGTTVTAGTLAANNASGSATGTGAVQVQLGATLAGTGSITGTVSVAKGGVLSAGNGGAGTLTLGGLSLASGAVLDYDLGQAGVAGGSLNDLINVNGNLQLDGTLNVAQTAGGKFGAGLYRLINYTGTLTDNGLDIGTAPTSAANLQVQTSIANQVNLLNASGLALNMWDGAGSANINDGKVSGGSGTWRAGGPSTNWTGVDGKLNASWQQGGFAIFAGAPGTVTVDNTGPGGAVRMGGAQFAVSGYTVNGSALAIDAPATVVRVGDGTAASTGMSATIAAAIGGAGGLVKDDGGTLVLSGKNSYAGGTTVKAGVLRISSDANLGAAAGDLALDGGTLAIAAGSGPLGT